MMLDVMFSLLLLLNFFKCLVYVTFSLNVIYSDERSLDSRWRWSQSIVLLSACHQVTNQETRSALGGLSLPSTHSLLSAWTGLLRRPLWSEGRFLQSFLTWRYLGWQSCDLLNKHPLRPSTTRSSPHFLCQLQSFRLKAEVLLWSASAWSESPARLQSHHHRQRRGGGASVVIQ